MMIVMSVLMSVFVAAACIVGFHALRRVLRDGKAGSAVMVGVMLLVIALLVWLHPAVNVPLSRQAAKRTVDEAMAYEGEAVEAWVQRFGEPDAKVGAMQIEWRYDFTPGWGVWRGLVPGPGVTTVVWGGRVAVVQPIGPGAPPSQGTLETDVFRDALPDELLQTDDASEPSPPDASQPDVGNEPAVP